MLAMLHATVIDGTGSAPLTDVDVLVEGGKIVEVGKDLTYPAGTQVIDLTGKYLMPGLIDAHTHFGGSDSLERPGAAGRFPLYDYAESRERCLNWGVTTVRSAGDFTPDILEVRDLINEGKLRGPRILAAGRMLQADGGHPGFSVYFANPDIIENQLVLVNDETDVDAEVGKLAELGVDWIKTFASNDNKMAYPNTQVPQISDAQLKNIVDAAHKRGLPVFCHSDDMIDMERAIKAGVDNVEHALNVATTAHEVTPTILEALTTGDVWLDATMVATKFHDGSIEGAAPVTDDLMKVMGQLIKAGAKIGVGADSGIPFVPFGESIHVEMELLCAAGMTTLQALTAATGDTATMLRKEKEFGFVKPGMIADLLVLGSDPVADIKNSRDIKMVLRDGRVVVDRFLA